MPYREFDDPRGLRPIKNPCKGTEREEGHIDDMAHLRAASSITLADGKTVADALTNQRSLEYKEMAERADRIIQDFQSSGIGDVLLTPDIHTNVKKLVADRFKEIGAEGGVRILEDRKLSQEVYGRVSEIAAEARAKKNADENNRAALKERAKTISGF